MANPFLVLGIPVTSDADTVHSAYRRLVKHCHPDAVLDEAKKNLAQEKMIQLNLAYEEALRLACRPAARPITPAGLQETLRLALRLFNQKMYDSAVRILSRCPERSAQWYYLHGQALYALEKYEAAHLSFRHAVRLEPEDKQYRIAALRAYQAEKKSQQLPQRAVSWAKGILKKG